MVTAFSGASFESLIGEELSGVVFVRDYLQLQFNPPPILNAYTVVTANNGTTEARFGEPSFANTLIGMIGNVISAWALRPQQELKLSFSDGSWVSISLRPDDYPGPEAVTLFCRDGGMVVE